MLNYQRVSWKSQWLYKFLMPVVLPFITESLPSWPSGPEFHHSWVLSPCFISLFQTHLSLQNKWPEILGLLTSCKSDPTQSHLDPKKWNLTNNPCEHFPIYFLSKTQLQLWFNIHNFHPPTEFPTGWATSVPWTYAPWVPGTPLKHRAASWLWPWTSAEATSIGAGESRESGVTINGGKITDVSAKDGPLRPLQLLF